MDQTKYEALNDRSVQDQQALVQKTLVKTNKRQTHRIPASGKNMMNPDTPGAITSEEEFTTAAYNWLRVCRFFLEVNLNFASDQEGMNLQREVVVHFEETPGGKPPWEVQRGRKYTLAEQIAEVAYSRTHLVAIEVTKKGITAVTDKDKKFGPESETWMPHLDFLPNWKAKGDYVIQR